MSGSGFVRPGQCKSWRCGFPRGHAGACEPVPPGPDSEPDFKAEYDALRKGLQGEVDRLREREQRYEHVADSLQALLDSSGAEG